MVFSIDTIKSTLNKPISIKEKSKIEDIDNISIFFESLNLIAQENRNTQLLFESFNDNNQVVIQEKVLTFSDLLKATLKRIDYKEIMKKMLSGFAKILDTLWNHFHALLLNFFGEDNVIKAYKKKLQNVNIDINYDEDRFIYTNLGSSTSYITFKSELEKEISSLILGLSKISSFGSRNNNYINDIEELRQEFQIDDNYVDNLRGAIVGNKNPIMKEEFGSALYNYFRNNGYKISAGSIISSQELKTIYSEYFDNKNAIKEVSKDKKDLIKSSENIQKQIFNIKLENYIQDGITQEASVLFNLILENQCKRVKILCELFTQVFSAKLDAVKESYSQYKRILFYACKEMTRRGL